jgi:hypothetical protein
MLHLFYPASQMIIQPAAAAHKPVTRELWHSSEPAAAHCCFGSKATCLCLWPPLRLRHCCLEGLFWACWSTPDAPPLLLLLLLPRRLPLLPLPVLVPLASLPLLLPAALVALLLLAGPAAWLGASGSADCASRAGVEGCACVDMWQWWEGGDIGACERG